MRTVTDLPQTVTCHEHIEIAMRDGVRLAGRLWLPDMAHHTPVPAILEYIPYRKRDLTRARDQLNHPYLAGHGYACLRVDLRGSGESEGVLEDQYLETEQLDGEDVIAWLARQPWCCGRVGMLGLSWGGFNALQIAARRPKALGAVVSACATDDLYRDNMHYMGGCLLSDNLSEATTMLAFNSMPPDPRLVGDRWRELWLQRLRHSGLWLDIWLRHQRRDAFWQPGSVCEDYGAICCPVLAVSGWQDGFTNAVFRLLQHLDVPCRGLIGPWSHKYPHMGVPGPAIGFLQEVLRWFDHWLKDRDTMVERDPPLRVWMQDSVPPQTRYSERPGRWVAEPCWPSPRLRETDWGFGVAGHLLPAARSAPDEEVVLRSPLTVGLFAGKWCSYAGPPDLPADQRLEDGGALVFETGPLAEDLEILGRPVCELELSSDRPVAMVAARLCDTREDGAVTRVTYGLLNLTHRHGHEHPQPIEPGKIERVRLELNGVAQRFPSGHRIRLSLSTVYWPLAWPAPQQAALRLRLAGCALRLPVRPPDPDDELLRPFDPPEGATPLPIETVHGDRTNWIVHHDLATGCSTLEVVRDDGHWRIPEIDLTLRKRTLERYECTSEDPTSACGETRTLRALDYPGLSLRSESRTILTCDERDFHLHAQLDAYEGERRIFADTWNERIPRDLV